MTPERTRRIAIADDSPAFVAAAADYIASLPGYGLAGTVQTVSQALTLVENALPDVLLLGLGERLAERLPCRRVQRIPRHRVAQIADRALVLAGLRVLHAQREAQQRAVARGAEQLLKVGNH